MPDMACWDERSGEVLLYERHPSQRWYFSVFHMLCCWCHQFSTVGLQDPIGLSQAPRNRSRCQKAEALSVLVDMGYRQILLGDICMPPSHCQVTLAKCKKDEQKHLLENAVAWICFLNPPSYLWSFLTYNLKFTSWNCWLMWPTSKKDLFFLHLPAKVFRFTFNKH